MFTNDFRYFLLLFVIRMSYICIKYSGHQEIKIVPEKNLLYNYQLFLKL